MTVTELEAIVDEQLSACSSEQRAAFAAHRVPFHAVPIHRLATTEHVLVVAKFAGRVLYFEDVEDGFAISELGVDGAIPEQDCNQYELCHVLSQIEL
ncbi:hypothetical protein [Kinneretia aquatilis]|uniref:hypothetical protein n=1 Tax=Kinneretia aquatilis TaxID=2070761 RepID=UPI001A9F5C35|nr:hypothetical protein [Paucibacter aquatile]